MRRPVIAKAGTCFEAGRWVAMLQQAREDTSDFASWLLVAAMAVACLASLHGLGFVVDARRAVLPGLGVLLLIGAGVIGRARRQPRLAAGAVAFLQMTLFTILGVVLAYALAARGGRPWDAQLAAADARLGLHWPAILRAADAMPRTLLVGGIAYASLVGQMVVAIVALSARGRTATLRSVVAAAIMSGIATIAISGAVPAMGNLFDPAAYRHLPPSIAWQERALIAGLRDGSGRVLDLGRLMGIVSFPSYHAALPVILAWGLRDVGVLRIAMPLVAAVTILATPVFGGHYGVDVLGGLALAAVAIALAPRVAAWRPDFGMAPNTARPMLQRGHAAGTARLHRATSATKDWVTDGLG